MRVVLAFCLAAPVLLPAAAGAQQVPYGEARGWMTIADFSGGRFLGCGAMINRDGGTWGIAQDAGRGWRLVFGAPGNHGVSDVTIDIDRATFPYHQAEGDGINVYVPVDYGSLDAVRRGNWMTVSFPGGASGTLSLAGTAAAILKVEECVQNAGVVPGRAPAQRVVESDALRPDPSCPVFGQVRSPASQQPATIRFTNRADRALNVYWLDFDGQPQEYAGLMPGESTQIDSYAGHLWVARDFAGSCVGGVMQTGAGFSTYDLR